MATPGPSSRRFNKDGKPILSVTEIMDMLHVDDVDISDDDDADEDEDVVTTIIMDPPDELPEADTDEDSADSDDPDDPTGVHLPRKLLMAGGQRVRRAKRRPLFYGDQRRGVEGENKDEEDEEDGMDRGMNNNDDDVEENNNVDEENENEDEDEDYNNEDEDEDYQQDEGKKRKRGKGKKGQGKKSKGNKGKGKKNNKDEEKKTWSETDSGKVGSNISEFTESPEPDLSHLKTAYDYYMEFQPREFKEEVLHQSKLYAGTGTVRQLRLGNTNLPRKKEADKWERGSTKTVFQDDKICVLWKDNKPVYLASNKYQGEISGQAKRWSKVEKKHVMVDRPELVTVYNTYMGGVDVLDGMVSAYRIPIRKKKWWWPFYSWSLSVSAVNAWRLRCHVTGEKQPYIHFLRELVSQIYALHGSPPNPRGRSITLPVDEIRYDRKDHWMVLISEKKVVEEEEEGAWAGDDVGNEKKKRGNCMHCRLKKKPNAKTLYKCEKCNVALHIHCFKEYHFTLSTDY